MSNLLDNLAQLFGGAISPAQASQGRGLAAQAGDLSIYHPIFQQEMIQRQTDGMPPIPFEQWAMEKGLLGNVKDLVNQ